MSRVGIVTAMATEVWPLVRSWPSITRRYDARKYQFFAKENAVVVAGGIGRQAGMRAAEALVACWQPAVLVAAGLAGGLRPEWAPPRTMLAAAVIDEATGRRFVTDGGEGTVVSSRVIAGAARKRELALRFAADIVDMEGAAVAEIAASHGLKYLAVKAVSDELDFEFPPLQRFVDADGRFQSGRFALHALVHPQWWPMIVQLKRKSDRAARRLAAVLEQVIRDYGRQVNGAETAEMIQR